MSAYISWVAGWIVAGLAVVTFVTIAPMAAWAQNGRLGPLAIVIMFIAVASVGAMVLWTINAAPQRPLPRADRKHIATEKRRIERDRIIADLERKAGLR